MPRRASCARHSRAGWWASVLVLSASGFDLLYVVPRPYVCTDAATAATNIKALEGMLLAGSAAALIGAASYLVVTALLYRLYEPVNRRLSLSAALLSLNGTVIQAVALIFQLIPLLVLNDQPYLRAFTLDQRQALALVRLSSYGQAYNRLHRLLDLPQVLKTGGPGCGPEWPGRLTCLL